MYLVHLRDKIPQPLPNAYRTQPVWPKVGEYSMSLTIKQDLESIHLLKIIDLVKSRDDDIRDT